MRARSQAEKLLRKASAHRAAGRPREAERDYRRALEAEPGHAGAHYGLGLIASEAGAPERAVPHMSAALRAAPDQPGYWIALATALLAADRLAEARAILERFTAQGFADAGTRALARGLAARLYAEAEHHYAEGRLLRAEPLLDAVILLDDAHVEAVHMAGNIAAQTNRLERAFDLLSIAIHRDGTNAAYFSNLGTVLSRRGDHGAAIQAYERSLALDPSRGLTHSNLAGVHQKLGRLQSALAHLERATQLEPGLVNAHSNRGVVLKDLGRLPEAIAAFDRALALDPTIPFVHSNRLFSKLYAAEIAPEDYFADAVAFGARFADPLLRRRPFANARDPERRLRIGFVSGDLREHAVTAFLEPFLAHLDAEAFEAFAYSNTEVEDATTARLKGHFAAWRPIAGLEDEAVADLIEADGIDVLVDLAGHSAGNRLLVFARKPAPVQVSWIGHPGTTGLRAMDYRLTDRDFEPEGTTDALHTERLWRLPRVTACYRGDPACPEPIDHPPHEDSGHVTFGCFNRFTKVSDGALAAWARILEAVPDARLLLEIVGVDDPALRAGIEARLARLGLPPARVDLEPRLPRNRYVLYDRVDLGLDPFPYNGGTTSLDSLYMGVPFVALEGRHTVSRMGAAILKGIGLGELAAPDLEGYVSRAVGLAQDRARLKALREGLRARMIASPHMDHRGLADDVGRAFRAMWRRWLAESPPAV